MIELECLEFQLIIGIYGSRFLKIYFLDSLSRVHVKNLIEYLGWRRFVFKMLHHRKIQLQGYSFLVIMLLLVLYKLVFI